MVSQVFKSLLYTSAKDRSVCKHCPATSVLSAALSSAAETAEKLPAPSVQSQDMIIMYPQICYIHQQEAAVVQALSCCSCPVSCPFTCCSNCREAACFICSNTHNNHQSCRDPMFPLCSLFLPTLVKTEESRCITCVSQQPICINHELHVKALLSYRCCRKHDASGCLIVTHGYYANNNAGWPV